jgi:D-alanyl-D-alanine carboxypeptidase
VKRLLLCTSLLVSLCACGSNDDDGPPPLPAATQAAVDATVEKYLADGNLPGAVVLISIPGEGEMVKAYGKANLQTQAPRTTTDPFRIASITKAFTATAVLQLADSGALALTDKVSKWYPTFPNGDLITVDHLLRMRSGIVDPYDLAFLAEFYAHPLMPFDPDEMIARAAALGAQFQPPDVVTSYNNLNYVMLERIATKVDGRPLQAQLDARVFQPLGMRDSIYATDSALAGSTRGYGLDAATQQFADKTVLNPTVAGGAGAMISTVRDLALYVRALCTGGLLSPAQQSARLQGTSLQGTPAFVKYGAGVELLGQFCGHNGTISGFSSEMFYLPAKDAVIVINVNRLDIDDHSKSSTLFLLLTKQLFSQYVNW